MNFTTRDTLIKEFEILDFDADSIVGLATSLVTVILHVVFIVIPDSFMESSSTHEQIASILQFESFP
jgi:hypothetical protein